MLFRLLIFGLLFFIAIDIFSLDSLILLLFLILIIIMIIFLKLWFFLLSIINLTLIKLVYLLFFLPFQIYHLIFFLVTLSHWFPTVTDIMFFLIYRAFCLILLLGVCRHFLCLCLVFDWVLVEESLAGSWFLRLGFIAGFRNRNMKNFVFRFRRPLIVILSFSIISEIKLVLKNRIGFLIFSHFLFIWGTSQSP